LTLTVAARARLPSPQLTTHPNQSHQNRQHPLLSANGPNQPAELFAFHRRVGQNQSSGVNPQPNERTIMTEPEAKVAAYKSSSDGYPLNGLRRFFLCYEKTNVCFTLTDGTKIEEFGMKRYDTTRSLGAVLGRLFEKLDRGFKYPRTNPFVNHFHAFVSQIKSPYTRKD